MVRYPKPTHVQPQRPRRHGRTLSPREPPVSQSKAMYVSLLTISSSFNPLFRVLFTFPSQYLFAIGLAVIFSFGRDQPPVLGLQSQTTRLEERAMTIDPAPKLTGLSPSVVEHLSSLEPQHRTIITQSKNYNSAPRRGMQILSLSFARFIRHY